MTDLEDVENPESNEPPPEPRIPTCTFCGKEIESPVMADITYPQFDRVKREKYTRTKPMSFCSDEHAAIYQNECNT